MHTHPSNRWLAAAIGAGLVLNLLVANHSTPLWDQDEAAYAGFAHTMVRTGDWAIPEFTWSDPHRKPPLHFWMIAASFSVLGENTFALRLPGILAFALTCALLGWWGSAVLGTRRAWGGAAVLATSLAPLFGKVALVDGPLLLAQTVAALGLLRFIHTPRWRWAGAVALGAAAGMLLKGPPVLILVIGAMGVLAVLHPARRRLVGLHPWLLLPLSALPLVAWGWVAWQRDDGAFVRWMFDWYVLRRASGGVFGQTGPPGTYLASFALLLFPWFGLLPAALVRTARKVWARDPIYVGLAAWLAAGWLIYEILPSKLPAYALGAYPALAVILADQALDLTADRVRQSWLVKGGLIFQGLLSLVIAGGLVAGAWMLIPGEVLGGLVVVGAVIAVATVAAAWLFRRGEPTRALAAMVVGSLLFFHLAWAVAMPQLQPRLGITRTVADQVAAVAPPGAQVIAGKNYRLPSLVLYLQWMDMEVRQAGKDEDLGALLGRSEPVVLILDDGRREVLGSPAGLDAEVSVDGWIPDKGVPIRFWILANEGTAP
jgi:4-amino-4-deoxy-L-arabinose transferase-like glycosyltransferase